MHWASYIHNYSCLTNQLLLRSLLIDYVLSYYILHIQNENVHWCLLVIFDLYFVHMSYQMSSRWRKKVYWLLFSNNFKMGSPWNWRVCILKETCRLNTIGNKSDFNLINQCLSANSSIDKNRLHTSLKCVIRFSFTGLPKTTLEYILTYIYIYL